MAEAKCMNGPLYGQTVVFPDVAAVEGTLIRLYADMDGIEIVAYYFDGMDLYHAQSFATH